MELPITVIIVLFVAVAVSVGVIGFASYSLTRAEQQVGEMGRSTNIQGIEDGLVQVAGQVSPAQVKSLGEQCYRDMREKGTVQRRLCYVVTGTVHVSVGNINALNNNLVAGAPTGSNWRFDVSVTAQNTVFIYYDPMGKIEVRN
jgi:hypothetical protein